MNNSLFKTAMIAALESMDQDELDNLDTEYLVICHLENYPNKILLDSFHMYTIFDLFESHLEARDVEWEQLVVETLNALWALQKDSDEKTVFFMKHIFELANNNGDNNNE